MRGIFDKNGIVRLAPKVDGDKPYIPREISAEERAEIDMCLNCTKKKCNGNCIDIRRNKNGKLRHY